MIPEILELMIPITGILVGGLVILIPVSAVCARLFLKPTLESLYRLRYGPGTAEEVRLQDRRVALLETEVQALQDELRSLREARDFDGLLKG